MEEIWNEIMKLLSGRLSSTAMTTWFTGCRFVAMDDAQLVLCVNSELIKKVILSRFSNVIKETVNELLCTECDITILVGEEEMQDYLGKKTFNENDKRLPMIDNYAFERFIVGSSNEFAFKASQAVAKEPGNILCNPLFIYGNSGLGKTHLLYAIGQYVQKMFPDKKVCYVKADDFTSQLIIAIKQQSTETFRNEYRNVDLLLIDDIEFISGKEATQLEFFNTFNTIYQAGHQIVLTSDRPPREMAVLEDRLKTRFEGGIMAEIKSPEEELRLAIVREKSFELGLNLSESDIRYIADKLTKNVRQLEGVLKNLYAYKEIMGYVPTDQIDRAMIGICDPSVSSVTPELILNETARFFGVSPDEIKSQTRAKKQTLARHVSAYLLRSLTPMSLEDIGKEIGNRDHTTVAASIKKVIMLIDKDADISLAIRDITSNVMTPY